MSPWKAGLAALIALAGLSGSARAQNFAAYSAGAYSNGYSGGYGNYAVSGPNPYYGGTGVYGVGPRGYARNYGRTSPNLNAPLTSNNLGGLMGTIRQQTGRSGGYRRGPNAGMGRGR